MERERHRLADTAADTAQVRSLMAWCRTVAQNLDGLTYDEKRSVLAVLRAQVCSSRRGSHDGEGRPHQQWELLIDPRRLQPDGPSVLGPKIFCMVPPPCAPLQTRITESKWGTACRAPATTPQQTESP